jgi:hypothetical protein
MGRSSIKAIGALLFGLGCLAILVAPSVMNHAEVRTLRVFGALIAIAGAIVLGTGVPDKKP